jgi:hypothetical protein
MSIDWIQVIVVAIGSIGIIQWAKGVFPSAPTWVWISALPVSCLGVTAITAYLPSWVSGAIVGLAVAQLGYENIVQLVKRKVDAA